MHHKFTKHGKASARGGACAKAIDYLLGELDHKGEKRPDIQVLRGDPYGVAAVSDTLDFSRTYTSAVISWAPEEAPTDAEMSAVLDDWEKLAFSGLEPDRYAFTAVMHGEEGGGGHIHIIAARVDLVTGKSLNIAPPGHQKYFDAFRDKWNHEKGWARPDDPLRKRILQPDFEAYRTKPNTTKLKTELTECFDAAIEQGLIKTGADLRQYITEMGCEITRSGKDYLSLKPYEGAKAIRLKGEIYGESWEREITFDRQVQAKTSLRDGRGGTVDEARADAAQRDFDAACERRAKYNEKRYCSAERSDQLTLERPEPISELPAHDLGGHEKPHAERDEADQTRANPRTSEDTGRSYERLETSAKPSPERLTGDAEQDLAAGLQDAAQPYKRLDSTHEREHGHSPKRGRSLEQDSPKSVAETLAGLSRSDSGRGRSVIFDSRSAVSVPQLRNSEASSAEWQSTGSPSSVEPTARGSGVRGGRREEVPLFQEDQRSSGLSREAVRGDRVNDRDRAASNAAATASPVRLEGSGAAAQERNRSLAAAAKRLAERFGEYAGQLQAWVQDTAERFRVTQRADAERLTDVQRADRERLEELTSPEPAARSADGSSLGTSRAELEQVSAASHELDRAGQVLDESLRGLETAVTAHLERKIEQEQGHTLRM